MNNFHNNLGKFVSPPPVLANPISIYRTEQKKFQLETGNLQKFVEKKPSGAFKIFYESKNFKPDEPHLEWNVKRKRSRVVAVKKSFEGKNKTKKTQNKIKIKDPSRIFKYTTAKFSIDGDKTNNTQLGSCKEEASQKPFLFTIEKNPETIGKRKTEPEIPPKSSLFTPAKTPVEVKKKQETIVKGKVSTFSTNSCVTRKPSEKSTGKHSETKTIILDVGKKQINDILKNHAQKTHPSPVKTLGLKDLCPTEEKNPQQKIPTNTTPQTTVNEKSEHKLPLNKIEKHDEIKSEIPPVKEQEQEEKSRNDEIGEAKKKIPNVLLNVPRSRELDRRLNNTNQDTKEDLKLEIVEGSTDDEKNSTENSEKTEKRITYTDRLLTLKLNVKNPEEKKPKTETKEITKEVKKTKPTETAIQKPKPSTTPLLKEIVLTEANTELKPKPTSSGELKDLVSQAIREHKIFCIFDNHTYIVRPVREELLNRGWVEVIPDRRLIPRRRPPPLGPTYERDKNAIYEQNSNSLQAILAAREIFVNEIEETVSKSAFKLLPDKPKTLVLNNKPSGKKSEDSLSEAGSQFRIHPPTSEKTKNNVDIREFVVKYQAYVLKEQERENEMKNLLERENNAKLKKKAKEKQKEKEKNCPTKDKEIEGSDSTFHPPLAKGSISYQNIAKIIKENSKTLMETKMSFKNLEVLSKVKPFLPALDDKSEKSLPAVEEQPIGKQKTQTNTFKSIYSDSDAKTISKLILAANARIHFMWLSIKPGIHLKCFNYSPEIINKFQKTTFCTKIGLWSHLNNMQWYAHEVHHPAKSPRMYNTGEADDLQAFFQDFHLTACLGILKWLCDTLFERGLKAIQTKRGKVPLKAFEFAIRQCERYIRYKENEELNLIEETKLSQEEWNTFLQYFYIITNDNGKIQEGSSAQIMVVYTKATETLKIMKRYWPEIDIDGRLNIWIMKPYCASCGRGIFMTNNVYYISQHSKYIVQKYIEKPLLIYNTKFDIRQWFMITKLTPLEIWMYKECYLRFCSQPFALRNLHESVHLSNNSVQRKYINIRDPYLPDQNMWDSKTFQLYLKTIGFPNAWEEIIYPGMRDAIVSTMLAAQDTFDGPRKSWFEVYGADFMLSANLKEGPWLIEINENPAMDPSTKVTSRLCPQMLRDVIKVVIDKRANKNANTGQWELIYRQNYSPSFGTVDLDVRGKKLSKSPYLTTGIMKNSKPNETKDIINKLYEQVKDYKTSQAEYNKARR